MRRWKNESFLAIALNQKATGYSLKTNKKIISQYVEFDEDASYNWETKEIEGKTIDIPMIQVQQRE